jgi:urease
MVSSEDLEIVRNTRTVTKLDMKFNNATPKMEVDPEAFVSLDGTALHAGLGNEHHTT